MVQIDTNKTVQLWLVGDGDLKQLLIDRASERGLNNRLVLTGPVPYKQIPRYVKAMDICVIPDSNDYRSPIKMFEYMAMSKTVVAPGYEPITKVIEDGVDGVIFEPQSWQCLASALERLVNHPDACVEMGARARKKILSKYLWINNAKEVIDIYQDIEALTIEAKQIEQ